MNIVLIRSNPVRPYPRLEKMAGCLLRLGYGVTVLAWDRESDYEPKEEELELGEQQRCKIFRIGLKGQFSGGIKKNLLGLICFQKFIYSWLKSHRDEYDVVHAYDLDTGFTAQKAAKRFHKVFVYDIPDYYSNGHGYTGALCKISNLIENRVINQSYATIICTEERREEIKGSKPKRLYVIHNTPNIPMLIENAELHERTRLAYVGIFGEKRFLRQLCDFVAKRIDCELHLGGYGSGMESYFEDMAEKHENIIYYGRVPYQRTLEIEQKSDILPVIYDPGLLNHVYAAPNKFYEALALGKPLIMAKGTGMSSVVDEYDLGATIDYNVDSLEQAINRLIDRKTEWPEIGKREQELYESSYSWAEMEKRIQTLYDDIKQTLKG